MNIDRDGFLMLLKKHARVLEIAMNDEIFGFFAHGGAWHFFEQLKRHLLVVVYHRLLAYPVKCCHGKK